jgi:hypothetical protein
MEGFMLTCSVQIGCKINPLNAELNPICHLLALLGAHHIFYVRGVRVKGVDMNIRPTGALENFYLLGTSDDTTTYESTT